MVSGIMITDKDVRMSCWPVYRQGHLAPRGEVDGCERESFQEKRTRSRSDCDRVHGKRESSLRRAREERACDTTLREKEISWGLEAMEVRWNHRRSPEEACGLVRWAALAGWRAGRLAAGDDLFEVAFAQHAPQRQRLAHPLLSPMKRPEMGVTWAIPRSSTRRRSPFGTSRFANARKR
jgi:hypothetical protein